ncbi:hypothetical protein GJ496_008170 [Pomphorhynchus laevis]|nr:hypothetical protein GJ496_008170 [Pomphorhynchus laevis]
MRNADNSRTNYIGKGYFVGFNQYQQVNLALKCTVQVARQTVHTVRTVGKFLDTDSYQQPLLQSQALSV